RQGRCGPAPAGQPAGRHCPYARHARLGTAHHGGRGPSACRIGARGLMKRLFDLALAVPAALVLLLPIACIALAVRLTSPGPALYWSDRVGRHNRIFRMPKFRSMRIDTPAVATHLLADPQRWLTPIGPLLRRSSLDELPQIWSILK